MAPRGAGSNRQLLQQHTSPSPSPASRAATWRFLRLIIGLGKPRQVRQGSNLVATCKEEVCVSAPTIKQGALPRVRQAIQQLLPPLRAARYQLQVSVHIGRLSLMLAGPAAPSLANLNVKTQTLPLTRLSDLMAARRRGGRSRLTFMHVAEPVRGAGRWRASQGRTRRTRAAAFRRPGRCRHLAAVAAVPATAAAPQACRRRWVDASHGGEAA